MNPIRKQFGMPGGGPATVPGSAPIGGAPVRATPPQKVGKPLGQAGQSPQLDALKKKITGGPVTR